MCIQSTINVCIGFSDFNHEVKTDTSKEMLASEPDTSREKHLTSKETTVTSKEILITNKENAALAHILVEKVLL
jgi:hypothetical protein